MAALAFSTFGAIAGLVGFCLAVAWVRHSPPVGVALVCLMIVPLWERPALFRLPIVTLSGASFYIFDVVTLILFAAGVLQVRQLRANLRGWLFPWVLFGLVIAVALLRASAADGAAGVNSARWLLHFFWAMTWVMAVRPDRLRLHTLSLVTGWALVLTAMYHGVTYGFGGAVSRISTAADDLGQSGRVLTASQSLVLLLCAATVFLGEPSGSAKSRPRFDTASALVFGGVVFMAQNRSVWFATVSGLAAVLIWSARRRARQLILVQLALGAGVALVAWNSGVLAGSQLSESMSSSSTYEWRKDGWHTLVSHAITRGPESVIFGEPSSRAFLREMTPGQTTWLSAHNWYVDTFVYLGLIGLIALITIMVSALVKSREKPAVCTFVLAAVATYGWPYSVEWYVAPWLGAAITVSLSACRIAEDPDPSSGQVARPNVAWVRAV